MSALSEDDKYRIREEMEYRQAIAQELATPKKGWEKFSAVCAHPVVITIFGGLLIAGAAALFAHLAAMTQQELQYQRQLLDKKFSVLSTFTEQFERDMTMLYNLRTMEITKTNATSSTKAAKEWEEIKDRYWKMVEEHSKKHRELGVILEVKALYTRPEVHAAADKLYEKSRAFVNHSLSEQQIEQLGKETEEGMRELALEMGKEINQRR